MSHRSGRPSWRSGIGARRRGFQPPPDPPGVDACWDPLILAGLAAIPNDQFLAEKAKSNRCSAYDRTSNGCALPGASKFGAWLGTHLTRFEKVCDQHDFGYRNFGPRGKGWLPTEQARKLVDDVLLRNMRTLCLQLGPLRRSLCLSNAHSRYKEIRNRGDAWW